MRMYNFACKNCHKEFEELVSSPEETVRCPKCHSTEVGKVLSAVLSKGQWSVDDIAKGSGCFPNGNIKD